MEQSLKLSKLIIGTVVTFIVYFGIGGIWHFALFADYYYHNPEVTIGRTNDMLSFIITGEILHAFAATWFFLMIYRQGASLSNGFMFGLICGIMTAAMWGFVNYGAFTLPMSWVGVDSGFSLVQGIAGGLGLALLNRNK